jgi:hypothetical protein
VLLGKGDGSFQSTRTFRLDAIPFHVPYSTPAVTDLVVGDFDGDGHLDLAVAEYGHYGRYDDDVNGPVSILLGNGDGTFRAGKSYPTILGSLVAADLNGDGRLDLLTSGGSILLGRGDGTFETGRSFGPAVYSVAVGDFNGDGRLDLAVSTYTTYWGVSILLGNGDGTFQPGSNYTGVQVAALAVGDFNHDGAPDLALTAYGASSGVRIMLGNGNGTFRPATTYAPGLYLSGITVGDFNGDGILDLAAAMDSNTATVLLGNGDGTFQTPWVSYGVNASYAESLASGDFNGDGHLDLAATVGGYFSPAGVTILLGQGDGGFRAAPRHYIPNANGQSLSVAVGDLNGDGILDLVTSAGYGGSGSLTVFLGKGDGAFLAAQTNAAPDYPQSVVLADLNGDGKLDLIVVNSGVETYYPSKGSLNILLGNGDGTFGAARSYDAGSYPTSVVSRDFNGDGIPDLAVANLGTAPDYPTVVNILLGNGDGTFQAAQSYPTGSVAWLIVSVAAGDFNGDGVLDLAVASYGYDGYKSGAVSILLGNGDGTFQPARIIALDGPNSIVVGDVNGDGKADIITTDFGFYVLAGRPPVSVQAENDVRVLLGNGDGTFQPFLQYPVKPPVTMAALADFNRDGILDVAVAAGTINRADPYPPWDTLILLSKGDGSFSGLQDYTAGVSFSTSVAVGDFNGDGFPDLAVATGKGVTVLLNAADWNGGPGAPALHKPPLYRHAPDTPPVGSAILLLEAFIPEAEHSPLSLAELPPDPVPQWPTAAKLGQPAHAETNFLSRRLFTSRYARDAVFEGWGASAVDVLAWNGFA